MRYLVLLILAVSIGIGCAPPAPEEAQTTQQNKPSMPPGAGSGTSEVAPMTPSAVPNAPVSGGTSLGDGGGSVGIAAKGRAKDVANTAGSGSLGNQPQNPDDVPVDDQ